MSALPAGDAGSTSKPIELPREVRAVNLGLSSFGEALRAQGAEAVDVDWRIPAGGRPELVAALSRLYGPLARQVDEANREAVRRMEASSPVLTSVRPALEVVPGMEAMMVLHSGPPLDWGDFPGPLRRSVRATVVAQGWASSTDEAGSMVAAGKVRVEPANHHATVLPMASSLGSSDPVFVVENPAGGNRAHSSINQGPGQVAWFGVESPEAIQKLVWLREVAGPVLDAVLQVSGPIDLFSLAAQGLQMGDDVHMRSQATTNLLIRTLLPYLVAAEDRRAVEVARALSANHLFFLNLAMAAAKATTDWMAAVPRSSLVVSMARNAATFGIKLAATGDRWFVAPAPPVGSALYHPGFGPDDAAPDIGDSAVLELIGLGGAVAAASPAVAGFLGGMREAVAMTEAVESICVARSERFKVATLDFRGAPIGVDVRRVVELETVPAINTGILDAEKGRGQIGAGIARAPLDCFRHALVALDETFGR